MRKNPGAYVNARPARRVEDATRAAQQARAEAETLRALPPSEAVERIDQASAAEQAASAAARVLAECEHQLRAFHTRVRAGSRYFGGSTLVR